MPCNGDYLQPNEKETQIHLVCQLLVYVFDSLGISLPQNKEQLIRGCSKDPCGSIDFLDDYVKLLCDTIKSFNDETLNRIVYNGRNPMARKLADWWDRHQEADRERLKAEEAQRQKIALIKSALVKLTPEERAALGYGTV